MTEIKDKFIYVSVAEDMYDEDVADLLCDWQEAYPGCTFISPQLSFGHLIKILPLTEIASHHLTLLDLSDEIWVFGENLYTAYEQEYADKYHIPLVDRR